jgi:hypothetical protein
VPGTQPASGRTGSLERGARSRRASREAIDGLLGQHSLALVGASRNGKGFGNVIRRELTALGYDLVLVHPEAEAVEGHPCARRLRDVAPRVGGVVLVTPPASTTLLVREAVEAGIRRVWMQQGAESDEAIRYCEDNGVSAVHHECILLFAGTAGFPHGLHRWMRRAFGRQPA